MDMGLLKGEAHDYWMTQFQALQSHGKLISQSSDVEKQREQFSYLSSAMVNVLKAFGTMDTLYIQHCPMAKDDAGADWLSAEKEIHNPYFGDNMLSCGTVEGVLSNNKN
jgi:Cu(I)/Ag(I) efflux system membrane fusion protein